MNELAEQVAAAMGNPGHPTQHLPARNEVLHAFSDHSKARAAFQLGKETTLADGLSKMADWARNVKLPPVQGFADIEVEKNMPPSWLKYQLQTA